MSYLDERRKHIEDGRPLPPKKKYTIPKKSNKRIQKEKEQGVQIIKAKPKGWFDADKVDEVLVKEDSQWDWFVEQRKLMTGFCKNCGRPSCKNDDKKFHFSLAHILEKAHFPSIAKHPLNVIELCFWGEGSCHTRMDNKMLDLTEMACWDEIVTKVVAMYPSIDKSERRRIPSLLLQYINTEL
jgi:hypothetical protein